jgi:hypothetical protein
MIFDGDFFFKGASMLSRKIAMNWRCGWHTCESDTHRSK